MCHIWFHVKFEKWKVGNTAREPRDELIIVQGRRQEPDAVKSLAFVFHYKSKDGGLLKIGWLWLYSYQQKPKGSVSETRTKLQ